MNRISRRSAAEEAEALLEAGRTDPVLHYDVELGLERHQAWLRSDAPLPEWAGVSVAAKSLMPLVVKTIGSAVLIGAVGVATWQVRGGSQPSAAEAEHASLVVERAPQVAAAVEAPRPLPVPDQGSPSEASVRRAVRSEVLDKRGARAHRASNSRTASTRVEHVAARTEAVDAPAARVESAATSATTPASREAAATPENKLITAAKRARPEPGPQAQAPDDLVEMQQVATAEQLLERSPERALALVREGDQRFARGYFQQERAYVAIMALIKLGRIEEARGRAASFAKQFPARPYGARIRSALEAQDKAAPSVP